MLKIYTTSNCLHDLASSYVNDTCNDWQKVMQLSQINYCGEDPFEGNCASDDLPEESMILLNMARCGTEFKFDSSNYIPSIKDIPEKVLEHPDAVFILDVEAETAKRITADYGVICHSVNDLEYCELTEDGYDYRPKRGEIVEWKDILDPNRIAPSNSMILIDRNYFTNVDFSTGELYAFADLPRFLDAFLPKSLSCSYDILLVFDKKDYTDRKGKHYDPYGFIRDQKGNVTAEGYSFEDLKTKLQQIVGSLNRPYTINVECLPIDKEAWFSKSLLKYNPYNDTHDRRIVTSYNIIETSFANAAFGAGGARASQKISLNLSHSKCLNDRYQTPPIESIEEVRSLVYRLLQQNSTVIFPSNRLVDIGQIPSAQVS